MAEDVNDRIDRALSWWREHCSPSSEGVQCLFLGGRPRGDAYCDRLLWGPASASVVERSVLGLPVNQPIQLVKSSGAAPYERGQDVGAEEFLFVPALPPDSPHRGGLIGLNDVVGALLTPETGCPWDLEQTHTSLKRFLMEESHELFDAIDAGDLPAMREEIGDVLLQPLMHARMMGVDAIESIAQSTADKLVRRHPHVFGDEKFADPDEVLRNWEKVKAAERTHQLVKKSMLDGVPKSLPALARAMAVSERVVRVGFEWPDEQSVWDKLMEEIEELREALQSGDETRVGAELGDLLFSAVQVGRWRGVSAEDALRNMLNRFTARFQYMEQHASQPLDALSFEEWDALWEQAKGANP